MNVLSDMLCHSSPLILSSSCNVPLLSHDTDIPKSSSEHNMLIATGKDELNLLDSLSAMVSIGRSLSLSTHNTASPRDPMFNSLSSDQSADSSNFEESEQASDFYSNSFPSAVPSWLTSDLLKASENLSSTVLSSVEDIYPATTGDENIHMLELGFHNEISSQDREPCSINQTCITDSQAFVPAASQVFSNADSLLLSTYSDINSSHLNGSADKGRESFEKYDGNVIIPHSVVSSQCIVSAVLPLNTDCNVNPNSELHLPLSGAVNGHCLNSSVNSDISNDYNKNHSMQHVVSDKLPQISINQLDSLLGNGNSISELPILSNNFSGVPIPDAISCSNHSRETDIGACNTEMNVISCHAENLSSLNVTSLSQAPLETSTSVSVRSEVNNSATFSDNSIHYAIEETSCFKCKYCSFISLSKSDITTHLHETHTKSSSNLISSLEMPNYNYSEQNIFSSSVVTSVVNINSACNEAPGSLSVPLFSSPDISHRVGSAEGKDLKNMLSQVENSKFICSKCGLSFNTLRDCETHLECSHSAQSDFQSQSAKQRNKKSLSAAHLSKQRETNPHIQNIPNVNSIIRDQLNRLSCNSLIENVIVKNTDEVKKTNKKSSAEEIKSTNISKRISSHKKAWQKKMKREHGSYICEFKGCNVRFRALDNLEYHRKCHIIGSTTFSCPECEVYFENWGSIAGHLWRHHCVDMELHACNQCSFKTYSLSRLENLHKKIHQNEYLFLCDTCGKGFKTGKQLWNHRVIHSRKHKIAMSRNYECSFCCRCFLTKRLLKLHVDTVHSKIKPFICKNCGYSASKQSTLRMHLRQHTGEKPFSCDTCDYQTSDHNSLRRHKMKHTGEKPYKCPHCTYACIQSSTYKVHLKKKHPDQSEGLLYSCNLCPFRTVKQDNFSTHMADHEMELASSNKSGMFTVPLEQSQRPELEALSFVEAMDISFSHSDQSLVDEDTNKNNANVQSFFKNVSENGSHIQTVI